MKNYKSDKEDLSVGDDDFGRMLYSYTRSRTQLSIISDFWTRDHGEFGLLLEKKCLPRYLRRQYFYFSIDRYNCPKRCYLLYDNRDDRVHFYENFVEHEHHWAFTRTKGNYKTPLFRQLNQTRSNFEIIWERKCRFHSLIGLFTFKLSIK